MSDDPFFKTVKEPKRIDCKTLYGLINIIYDGGAMQKSKIVGKSKLNYSSFQSYLFWLEHMGLVEKISDRDDDEFIKLTEHGINLHSKI